MKKEVRANALRAPRYPAPPEPICVVSALTGGYRLSQGAVIVKIVDRKTFLALPPETLFYKYEPCNFGPLSIKGESLPNDFFYRDMEPDFETARDSGEWFSTLDAIQAGQPSPSLDFDIESRDGLFDEDQLFAVLEDDDVRRLIDRLQRAAQVGVTEGRDAQRLGERSE